MRGLPAQPDRLICEAEQSAFFCGQKGMSKLPENPDSQARGNRLSYSEPLPGSLDVDNQLRAVLTDSINRCKRKSREQIAEEMSYLLGREVTAAMLDAYTARSKREHRWPAAWTA